ncbi:MAG: ATP-dependent metallopeptidase FtsH/Yme1/Tma family protein, partial [Acidimicrobiales bacterium]
MTAQNSQNEASTEEKSVLTSQPAPADPTPAEDTSSGNTWAGRSNRRRQSGSAPPPWRVEGLKPKDQDQTGGRSGWSRFWLMMLGLLIVNWVLSSLILAATTSQTTISYTFFVTQVRSGNVASVTSTGDTIVGTFRHEVSYPARVKDAQKVQTFVTERPAFATDNLLQELQATGT